MARLRVETSPEITVLDESAVFKAASGATAPLVEFKNSSGTVVANVAANGAVTVSSISGVTKSMVGLGNVDNTSDANKPVSTATQTALDLKAPLASPTFTGTVAANNVTVSGNLTVSGTTTSVNTETLTIDDNIIVLNNNEAGTPSQNAGIEIERGTSTNVVLRWNETDDKWELTNDGTTYSEIATASSVATATALTVDNLTDVTITSAADKDFLMYNGSAWVDQPITLGTDTTGNYMSNVSAGTGISVTHTPGEGSTATIAVSNVVVQTTDTGTVTSTMIADGTIVNADVNASAAIALSKLASGTSAQVIVADSSGVPTYRTLSGDVTVSDTGVVTIAANSVALGTDTTGNYMVGVSAGTGISVTHTPGEGSTATIAVDATVATLASPALTGTPTAPTAAVGTSTTQIATTAFVMGSVDNDQFILAGQVF